MPKEDNDFNWVEVRQDCSEALQFELLRQTVEANVNERQKQLGEDAHRKVTFESGSKTEFRAMRNGTSSGFKGVVFRLREDHVFVQHDLSGKHLFNLTVVLNDDGECRFKVDGEGGGEEAPDLTEQHEKKKGHEYKDEHSYAGRITSSYLWKTRGSVMPSPRGLLV